MELVLGKTGRTFIAAGISLSTFGFLNLVILVSPRVYQTMASDGLFFPSLARLHPRFRTPSGAILFQGVWAIILTVTGRYSELLDYVVYGDWIFFGATAATLFYFRQRERRGLEPESWFRRSGHPVGTIIFLMAALYVVVGSVASNPGNAIKGTLLILLGIPVFYWWGRKKST
jgi:APA family basic amino acid/polyamine antiporter